MKTQEQDMSQLILSIVNSESSPETALSLICAYCFGNRETVATHVIKTMAGNAESATSTLLGRQAIESMRSKNILSAKEVATAYGIAPQNVSAACRDGRIPETDRVRTSAGWFILRPAAERVWGKNKGRVSHET